MPSCALAEALNDNTPVTVGKLRSLVGGRSIEVLLAWSDERAFRRAVWNPSGSKASAAEVKHAISSNADPRFRGENNVYGAISRGITGMRGDGTATVASPMYKDVFDLAPGVAREAPDMRLPVFAVRRHRGVVWVAPDVTSDSAQVAELLTEPTLVA